MKKHIIAAIAALPALLSCTGKSGVVTFSRPVKLYEVESMRFLERNYPGVVKSERTSNLAFKMSGQLVKLNVENGQRVAKGEFIAEIDPIDYNLQLDAARAAYINSKSQLERYSRLIAKQVISQQEYESVQAAYKRDKSNFDNAMSMVRETKLYAPFSGIIERRYVDNYQRVQPSEPVVRLIDPEALEVDFTLPENNIDLMKSGDKQFYITFEAYPATRFKAKVTKFVDASPDGSGVPVTVALDDPSFDIRKYTVRPGFSAEVTLSIVNDDAADITAVPVTALRGGLTGSADSVWIYNKRDSTVTLHGVTTGELFGKDMISVTDGLVPGDEVVTAGVYQLVEGEKVRPLR